MKLLGKILIEGKIDTITGLSIGGSDKDIMIGGIDQPIIKDSSGVPFIPGSSLKGKLRYLLEMAAGKKDVCSCGNCDICKIFGVGANDKLNSTGPTRIKIRDAKLSEETKYAMENRLGIYSNLELVYTEGKWENTISRKDSRANPRQLERVPAGAEFDLNLIFDIFEEKDIERFNVFLSAMNMLEDDYIGGHGSRGYGQVEFKDLKIIVKSIDNYIDGSDGKVLNEEVRDLDSLLEEPIRESIVQYLGVE